MSFHPLIRLALILCLFTAGITQQMIKPNNYPPARKSDQVDDYHGVKVADPYRWLEDLDSAETRQWVEAENNLTFAYLNAIPQRAPIRERLMNYLVDSGRLTLTDGAILHMAPNEGTLVRRFAAASHYVPADLDPSRYLEAGATRVDLMELADRDRFDLFYASHVMEHVPDDAAVLSNIFRALKPGGEAWLIVPLWEKPTEDGSYAMPPRVREQRFGQWDHVRQYGMDFADRIAAAGFEVEAIAATGIDPAVRKRHALGDILFRARKPAIISRGNG